MARANGLPATKDERLWHWRDSQEDILAKFPKQPPAEPQTGCGWWDETHHSLCVWDGRQWVCVPMD
jgi:hypothetical protein